ncbi:uncharacterized protein LOC112464548 [Temnothorax curvispinosus]|uniref:Uncharacterized protein LOC112464548 n=1 Tax=Temnothorax curvispinosus TaxID=300111 RepID=A0A6J1R2Q6_9HYME|nr:uncharacterized protein LOC112464548 [Temnothorax curvispinosus]
MARMGQRQRRQLEPKLRQGRPSSGLRYNRQKGPTVQGSRFPPRPWQPVGCAVRPRRVRHDNLDTLPSEEGPVPFKCDCFKSPLRLWGCIKSINESIMTFIVPGLNDWANRLEPEICRIQKQRSAETVTVLDDDTTPVSAESTDRSTVSPTATSLDDYYETVENHGKIDNVSNDRADNDGLLILEIHDEKLNDTAKIQYT